MFFEFCSMSLYLYRRMYDLSSNLYWKLPCSPSERPKLALGLLIPSDSIFFGDSIYFWRNVHSGCVLCLTKFFALYNESPVIQHHFHKTTRTLTFCATPGKYQRLRRTTNSPPVDRRCLGPWRLASGFQQQK
jgi:hypothetical protein